MCSPVVVFVFCLWVSSMSWFPDAVSSVVVGSPTLEVDDKRDGVAEVVCLVETPSPLGPQVTGCLP